MTALPFLTFPVSCLPRRSALRGAAVAACVLGLLGAGVARADAPGYLPEYSTVERFLYVQECMRDHPGPHYEMVNKCACAIDRLAQQLPFDEYVALSTAAKANSIGGERGAYIRDSESLQVDVRRWRSLQTQAKKACFVVR
ncbi:MAG: hypothetical protein L6Q75_19835 [Burkholderiaceae bacterium]|nr:hypothetical protein [Burkholderiaceae bacterium]